MLNAESIRILDRHSAFCVLRSAFCVLRSTSNKEPPMRSTRPFAQDYLTLIARAYALRADRARLRRAQSSRELALPAVVRTNFLTLYKPRVGVKVQAWFVRNTPSKVPELRVGVSFDLTDRAANASAGDA